jgi:hypothetical protein
VLPLPLCAGLQWAQYILTLKRRAKPTQHEIEIYWKHVKQQAEASAKFRANSRDERSN